ncbi:MAG: alpha/beta fold hydrolase [Chloroflexi bacterium]|nr:alpha/beta fold hydrolase [Chloroflexota bacterium]
MPTAPVNGIDLYYEVEGAGPTVVFAHGIGGNHASWHGQVPRFRERYTVVTFDHRAFGNSHDDPAGAGRSRFVDDLEGLLDHLGVERAALVAQSMGGGTCSAFTVRHPERVSALVLADTLVGIDEPPEIKAVMDGVREETNGLSQLERVLGPLFRARDPERTALYAAIASFNAANRRNLGGSLGSKVSAEDLTATGVPILFLVGEDDVLMPASQIAAFQRLVAGSKLVVVPRAGHSAYFEEPDAFNDAVLDFLADVRW